jgi:hypothetical protein
MKKTQAKKSRATVPLINMLPCQVLSQVFCLSTRGETQPRPNELSNVCLLCKGFGAPLCLKSDQVSRSVFTSTKSLNVTLWRLEYFTGTVSWIHQRVPTQCQQEYDTTDICISVLCMGPFPCRPVFPAQYFLQTLNSLYIYFIMSFKRLKKDSNCV